MAEIKWIKIATDIFDDEKVQLIENMPEHDAIIVIWFKLLCLAGKQNNGGVYMINERLAVTDEMLAAIFRRPLATVRLALEIFEQFGMIEIVDGVICVTNWEKHQSLDGYERLKESARLRQQKHREKVQALAAGHATSRDTSRSVTGTEEEKEGEEEKIRERDGEAVPLKAIADLFNSICVNLSPIRSIQGKREVAVRARWNEWRDIETFANLFHKAQESAFLRGKNKRGWKADFDWIVNGANASKILEGRYDDNEQEKTEGTFDTDEFLMDALRRTYGLEG